jgi:hypothetical protein
MQCAPFLERPLIAESRGSQCSLIADDGKYEQIGEGLLCGASSTGSRRPATAVPPSRRQRSFDGAVDPEQTFIACGLARFCSPSAVP